MGEYYRTIFTIEGPPNGLELLKKVESETRKWAGYEFGEHMEGVRGELEGVEGRLRFGRRSFGESGIFRLVWERPNPQDGEPGWRLGVRLATEGDDMEVDIEVQGLGSGDEKFQAAPPEIVSILFTSFHCTLDSRRLTTGARRVSISEEGSFRDELLDPARSIPLLVVSEGQDGPGVEDPDTLQRRLLGLVTVISYDRDTSWETSKNLPRSLRCYDGAMRLYSPGCSEGDVSQQHPYWLPSDVKALGFDTLCRVLLDECMNRLPRQGRRRLFSRMRDEIRREEMSGLEAQISELEERQTSGFDEQLFDELFQVLEDDELADDVDSVSRTKFLTLMRVARVSMRRANRLADEVRHLRQSEPAVRDEPTSAQYASGTEEDQTQQPASISEVLEYARDNLPGLRFLPSAFESAERVYRTGQFMRTERLRHVFEVMNECANERRRGSIGRLTQWFADRQVTYARRESRSTNQQFPHTRIYGGLHMEEHFKLSDGSGGRFELRIYVFWDEQEYQWLIGHVGEHEPTSTDRR